MLIVCAVSARRLAAEMRTWTDKKSDQKRQAEFVSLDDNKIVVLRDADGTLSRVRLDSLSTDDQIYVVRRGKAKVDSGEAKQAVQRTADALEKKAQKCRTAAEALAHYNLFLADVNNPAEQRNVAQSRLAEWEERVAQKAVRLGKAWIAEEDADEARSQSKKLLLKATDQLRSKRDKEALSSLLEASQTDPDSIHADFLIGLVYAVVVGNYEKSTRHFIECLKRQPEQVAVLNNLALSEIRQRNFKGASKHWKEATRLAPANDVVYYNLKRLTTFKGHKVLVVPPEFFSDVERLLAKRDANIIDTSQEFPVANPSFDRPVRTQKPSAGEGWRYAILPDVDLGFLGMETDFLVDDKCVACNAMGRLDCPVRDCAKGKVSVMDTELLGRNPVSGDAIVSRQRVRVPCKMCRGTGFVQCPVCKGRKPTTYGRGKLKGEDDD